MGTLDSLQALANKSQFVSKTRQTTCIVGKGSLKHVEKRLWIWFMGYEHSWLIKEDWLTGDDHKDLAELFKRFLSV